MKIHCTCRHNTHTNKKEFLQVLLLSAERHKLNLFDIKLKSDCERVTTVYIVWQV